MTQTLTADGETVGGETPARATQGRSVTLARPLLGFPRSTAFCLQELGERYAPFMALSSLDEPGLDFVVVAPGTLFEDYVVEIGDADVALLDLQASEEVEILVLVSRHPGAVPTVNLLGPLVLNRRTGIASQVVLQDSHYAAAVPVDAGTARTEANAFAR